MKQWNKLLKVIGRMKKPAMATTLAFGTVMVVYKALEIIKDC